MRRLIVAVPLLALLALTQTDCRHRRNKAAVAEDDGQLLTIVNVADPRAAVQLTRGFYAVEANAWRWAAKDFAVALRRPANAAKHGARLEMKFSLPDAVYSRVGAVTVAAKINQVQLPPATFSMAGAFTYAAEVPASALAADTALVEFTVDKAIPPGDRDQRELALVVLTIGLLPK